MTIVNKCVNNHCSRCGGCCTDFAYISDGEINSIKTFLSAHPEIQEQNGQIDIYGNLYLLCPFYSREHKKCLIYKVRPKICRSFKCNLPVEKLEAIKKSFGPNKYHNVQDMLSWHLIFFDNPLHQLKVMEDAKGGKCPL